jgi:hypothetical protein
MAVYGRHVTQVYDFTCQQFTRNDIPLTTPHTSEFFLCNAALHIIKKLLTYVDMVFLECNMLLMNLFL